MKRSLVVLAVTATTLGLARTVMAQGFQVNEHGTCVMGRGGAGVAKPCADGSGMFYNPAGLLGRTGWIASAGFTLIDANGGFTEDLDGDKTDLENAPIAVPHAFVQYAQDQFAVGVGMFVPYGLGTQWPDTFIGKFAGYDNSLQNIYVQPTLAFKPHPKLTLGAGIDLVLGSVNLTQRVDLSENPVPGLGGVTFGQLGVPAGTQFANGALEGNGSSVGGHFGFIFEATDRIRVGARYMTRVAIRYEGDVRFTPAPTGIVLPEDNPYSVPAGTPLDSVVAGAFLPPAGPLLDQAVSAETTLPDQLTAGVAYDLTPAITLFADYNWVNWSLFKELPVNFANPALSSVTVENYEDTHGVRLGFDWSASAKLAVRGGYIYHTAAAPSETVTPLLPEGTRNEFTAGIGYAITSRIRVDAGYQYLAQQDRRGRTSEFPSGVTPDLSLNNGLYAFSAHLFGLTLTAGF
jgi:long-chain fatty acid transport protein